MIFTIFDEKHEITHKKTIQLAMHRITSHIHQYYQMAIKLVVHEKM